MGWWCGSDSFMFNNAALQTLNYNGIEILLPSISQYLLRGLWMMNYEWVAGARQSPCALRLIRWQIPRCESIGLFICWYQTSFISLCSIKSVCKSAAHLLTRHSIGSAFDWSGILTEWEGILLHDKATLIKAVCNWLFLFRGQIVAKGQKCSWQV